MMLAAAMLACMVVGSATGISPSAASTGELLRPIPVIESSQGHLDVTFDIVVARRTVAYNVSFMARTYNGRIPGPTLLARPGDNVSITLRNQLETNVPLPGSSAPFSTARAANSSNLHVHGIYDSPEHDNTFLTVDPGGQHTWHYEINPSCGSSLMWYHPHLEGSSAMQLAGGMLGSFVVGYAPHEKLFESWDTHLLILQTLDMNPKSKDSIYRLLQDELSKADNARISNLPLQLRNPQGFEGVMLLANEQLAPRVPLEAGKGCRLRLINAISGSDR